MSHTLTLPSALEEKGGRDDKKQQRGQWKGVVHVRCTSGRHGGGRPQTQSAVPTLPAGSGVHDAGATDCPPALTCAARCKAEGAWLNINTVYGACKYQGGVEKDDCKVVTASKLAARQRPKLRHGGRQRHKRRQEVRGVQGMTASRFGARTLSVGYPARLE